MISEFEMAADVVPGWDAKDLRDFAHFMVGADPKLTLLFETHRHGFRYSEWFATRDIPGNMPLPCPDGSIIPPYVDLSEREQAMHGAELEAAMNGPDPCSGGRRPDRAGPFFDEHPPGFCDRPGCCAPIEPDPCADGKCPDREAHAEGGHDR